MKCIICNSEKFSVLYRGKIRTGSFGQQSSHDQTVYKCDSCQSGFLPDAGFKYDTSEYRVEVEGVADFEAFQALHDREQDEKLSVLGSDNLRGKVIADIGCGGGSFLDLVCGMAHKTVAVEPCRNFHDGLSEKHLVYGHLSHALEDLEEQVDLAVSFAVIEHVDDPLSFLKEMRLLLKPGGKVLISTPNYDDWMLKFLPGVYESFFYRKAHQWYFNKASLQALASMSGYNSIEIIYKNRFDLSNALHWIRDHMPTGSGEIQLFDGLDGSYKHILEQTGQTDFIYAWLSV